MIGDFSRILFMNNVAVEKYERERVGHAVFALADFQESETVIESKLLKTVFERSRYILELNGDHLLIDEPGVLVNHSCSPNCEIKKNSLGGFDFVALKAIHKGKEITFDYEVNESVVTAFQDCLCGSSQCRKMMKPPMAN